MKILEVCAGSIDSVVAAAKGGAARVELCSGLADGGVTPSVGLIRGALSVDGIKVNVLIRPREGDFLYSPAEVAVMETDVSTCRKLGCNGVVIGALTPDGNVNADTCRKLIAAAGDMEITFHRAFDLCRDPFDALDILIELGCHRVLTSGLAASAPLGRETLKELHRYAAGRIFILAGGGVNSANAGELASFTGVSELHASARGVIASEMVFRRDGISMGVPGADEYCRKTTSADEVAAIVSSLK